MNEFLQTFGIPFLAFLTGIIVGFLSGIMYERAKKKMKTAVFRNATSGVIFLLWSISMAVDIYKGESNTPLFLHLFMGAVIGAVNHQFGEWLLRLISKK